MTNRNFYTAVVAFVLTISLQASVKLPLIFGSNMVLQRNSPVNIWGISQPMQHISVTIHGLTASAQSSSDGKWIVTLPPMKEGGPYDVTICGEDTVVFTNVMIGEVWLCAGQSNMEFAFEKSSEAEKEIPAANNPMIRLFTVKRNSTDSQAENCIGSWSECSSTSVKRFSAVAYYFGKEIQKKLNVSIGLIHSAWGGTAVESWTPRSVLESDSTFQPILRRWDSAAAVYPEAMKAFDLIRDSLMLKWRNDSAEAFSAGKAFPPRPQEPRGGAKTIQHKPSGLFNGMIAPLIPLTFKGVIWYQGEANAARAYQYRTLFPAMIQSWRKEWKKDFPFLFVQLPNLFRQPEPSQSGWAELRESQLMALSLPKTGMAVTIDIGDPKDLHPTNKKDVGYRLALIAENLVYGDSKIVYSGPVYQSYTIEKNSIRLRFNSEGKLSVRGKTLAGFTIAGPDRKFIPASAQIEKGSIKVWSSKIKNPVAVRYAWGDNPDVSLYNDAGLPASPFRTDDWEEVTFGRK